LSIKKRWEYEISEAVKDKNKGREKDEETCATWGKKNGTYKASVTIFQVWREGKKKKYKKRG